MLVRERVSQSVSQSVRPPTGGKRCRKRGALQLTACSVGMIGPAKLLGEVHYAVRQGLGVVCVVTARAHIVSVPPSPKFKAQPRTPQQTTTPSKFEVENLPPESRNLLALTICLISRVSYQRTLFLAFPPPLPFPSNVKSARFGARIRNQAPDDDKGSHHYHHPPQQAES